MEYRIPYTHSIESQTATRREGKEMAKIRAGETKAATVEHDGIEYDLYTDDDQFCTVALAGSQVDITEIIKTDLLGPLEIKLWAALEKQSKQSRDEWLDSVAQDRLMGRHEVMAGY